MNFSVGADVEIQTKWKSNLLGVDFDFNTYKGTVVPNPKWLDKDFVSIRAAEKNKFFDYPINYIHKKYIVGHAFSEERSNHQERHTMLLLIMDMYFVIALVSNSEPNANILRKLSRCCERTTAPNFMLDMRYKRCYN